MTGIETIEVISFVIGIVGTILGIQAIIEGKKTLARLRQIREANEKLNKNLEKMEKTISLIEDATRRSLTGFAEIFHRAYDLIYNAERELWIVSLTLKFGHPHLVNGNVHAQFKELYPHMRNFQDLVEMLSTRIKAKVGELSCCRIITLKNELLNECFLARLAKRKGYENLKVEDTTNILRASHDTVLGIAELSHKHAGDSTLIYALRETLPIQLIIAGRPNNEKSGCLVFLVGTENIDSPSLGDGERGFYSEAKEIVDVFRDIAMSLCDGPNIVVKRFPVTAEFNPESEPKS